MSLPGFFHTLAAEVRNWGRWGASDERGTLNLIDADAQGRAAAAVRTGKAFALALPLERDGIQLGFIPGRVNAQVRLHQVNEPLTGDDEAACVNDDQVVVGLQAGTHWDSLAHVSYGGFIYNGFPSSVVTEEGTARCGIHTVGRLVTRGVLLDVARAKGVERLDGGYALTAADLDAAADMARVDVRPGDIVLIRTGQMEFLHRDPPDKLGYAIATAGPSVGTVPWFRSHDVAAVATDNLSFEVYPWEDRDLAMPVHLLHLVDMGLLQGQNWMLDDLAADCADDGVYAFLLEATPEPFVGAVGSPVAPVAIK
jgi:kynurenine formamidase